MFGVARVLALAALAGAISGCVTDGMLGAESDEQAKPRVIDTPKTRTAAKKDSSKKETPKKQATRTAPVTAEGDTEMRVTSVKSDEPSTTGSVPSSPAESTLIPAQSLFGNWTLGQDGGSKCRLILGGVPIGTAYAARGEADCPQAFTSVQTWEIQGDQLVLRNQSRAVVGRLQPTGPFRFDGQGEGGAAVYLVR